jgi:virulence-associated protein VapD
MTEQFNIKFGFKYDVDVLNNRYKRFTKQYYEIKSMVSQNGFNWEEYITVHTVVTNISKAFMNLYITIIIFAHAGLPRCSCFQKKTLLHVIMIYGLAVAALMGDTCFDEGFEYKGESKCTVH